MTSDKFLLAHYRRDEVHDITVDITFLQRKDYAFQSSKRQASGKKHQHQFIASSVSIDYKWQKHFHMSQATDDFVNNY